MQGAKISLEDGGDGQGEREEGGAENDQPVGGRGWTMSMQGP
jgi:hypothetical protein